MQTDNILRFANYDLDPIARCLRRDGERIPLSRRSFDVLLLLLQHPGEILSREELIKRVWPDTFVDENTLSQSISTLRRSLAERPGDNSYIATLPGRGYQFVAPVRQIVNPLATPAAAPPSPPPANVLPAGVLVAERTLRTSVIHHEEEQLVTVSSSGGVARPALLGRWAVLIIGAAVVTFIGFVVWRRLHPAQPQQHHELVLADFDNRSGDPIFDSVLKSALTIDLEQSPFLSLANEREIEQILRLMKLPSTTPVSAQIANEVCQRLHSDVYLLGTIARVGTEYLITLAANDCNSGRAIAQAKTVAGNQEGVLRSLDFVAASLRKQLGETSASIHNFNVPIEQATTSSLEALQAYSQARELRRMGKTSEAIPLFERAILLDPNFAMAYAKLGAVYENLRERSLERAYIARAYQLRDAVSADEKLYIEGIYAECVQEDLEAALRVYRTQAEMYPNDPIPLINMAGVLGTMGRHTEEVATAQRALALTPRSANAYAAMALAYLHASDFAQAKAVCAEAAAAGQAGQDIHNILFRIAVAQQDATAAEHELAHNRGTPDEAQSLILNALSHVTAGQLHAAESLFDHAKALAYEDKMDDLGHTADASKAESERLLGIPALAAASAGRVPDNLEDVSFQAALNAALAGDVAYAHRTVDQLMRSSPASSTLVRNVRIPLLRAAIALQQGKAAEAIALLQPAKVYEFRDYYVPSLLGQAHLAAHKPAEAEADYREIVSNPGLDTLSPMVPLAYLGLARALALQGKKAPSAEAYRHFFSAWNHADDDLPLLQQAKAELHHLDAPSH